MPMVALDGIITGIVLVRGLFGWEIRRYQGKLVRQLPDAVQLVVSATRAGLPVSEAFRAIAQEMPSPTRDEFIQVEREMALGTSADAALLALHRRTGVTEYAIFAVTIGVQARSGGRLAETIQNLADTVRERLAIGGKARALAGEAKVSAIIMIVLPIIVALLQSIMAPQQMALLFTEPRGLRLFAIGLITLITGSLTMQFMIRGATRD
jgi:tight adherence protein B